MMDILANSLIRLDSCKLIIPSQVESKIAQACQQVYDREWSGVLFFTYEGTFETELTIKCKDILLMDVGSAAFTEYTMSPEVISYMVDNDLLDCKTGHTHSHAGMAVFYSTTDMNTLREEGKDTNNFVSVVVNNKGDRIAAITRKVERCIEGTETSKYKLFDTETTDTKECNRTFEDIELYSIDVVVESKDEQLSSRIKDLSKKCLPSTNGVVLNSTKSITNTPSKVIEEPKLPSLFPEENVHNITVEEIKPLVAQIVTGSITIPYNDNSNLTKMIASMNTLYEKRFGNSEKGLAQFRDWASLYVDFILSCAADKAKYTFTDSMDKAEYMSDLAQKIIEYLSEYENSHNNSYLEIYIDELSQFILYYE